MSASELKPGDRITINGKAYCVKVEDGEIALRPFDPTPQPDHVRTAAERIAESLFVNGVGNRAQRLVLTVDEPAHRDLGGLCFGAVVDRIESGMRESTGRVVADEPEWAVRCPQCDGVLYGYKPCVAKCGSCGCEFESSPVVADEPWVEKVREHIKLAKCCFDLDTAEDAYHHIELALELLPAPREAEEVADAKDSWHTKTANDPSLKWLHHARSQGHDWAFDPDLCKITLPSDEQLKEWGVEVVGFFKPYMGNRFVTNRALHVDLALMSFDNKRLIVADAEAESDDTAARVERLERLRRNMIGARVHGQLIRQINDILAAERAAQKGK